MAQNLLIGVFITLSTGCQTLKDGTEDLLENTLSIPQRHCQAYVKAGWRGDYLECLTYFRADTYACFTDNHTSYYCQGDLADVRVKVYGLTANPDGSLVLIKEMSRMQLEEI